MTDEPAKYKALSRIFLSVSGPSSGVRIIEHGGRFELEGKPTIWMQPLNRVARAAKLKSIDEHWRETPFPAKIRPQHGFEFAESCNDVRYTAAVQPPRQFWRSVDWTGRLTRERRSWLQNLN